MSFREQHDNSSLQVWCLLPPWRSWTTPGIGLRPSAAVTVRSQGGPVNGKFWAAHPGTEPNQLR